MEKIKVGMYVRNERGIAKYLGLGKDVLKDKESREFKHYAMQHLFDETIFDVGHDWGDTLSEEEFKNIDRYIIGEPSKNITDLLQVGDVVTMFSDLHDILGNETFNIRDKKHLDYIKMGVNRGFFHLIDVVTKEKFNEIKYEVE